MERNKVPFVDEQGNPKMPNYAYDPRLVKVEDTYYIIWCTDFFGASIGMAKTKDFKTFIRMENPFIPFNRNAVLFPRKINGKYYRFWIWKGMVLYELKIIRELLNFRRYV